jgi:ribosomal protein S18 acetylase RimI-like enzyme
MVTRIARMDRAQLARELDALNALLVDTVESGGSIGFLPPFSEREAAEYWSGVGEAIDCADRRLFGVWADGELAGSVQLQGAAMPNGRHRGEVMKMMVHRRFRGRGLARLLLDAAEQEARRMGLLLLVLDTRQGDTADGIYRKLGWQVAGQIPGYARSTDGSLHTTVIFYKEL